MISEQLTVRQHADAAMADDNGLTPVRLIPIHVTGGHIPVVYAVEDPCDGNRIEPVKAVLVMVPDGELGKLRTILDGPVNATP